DTALSIRILYGGNFELKDISSLMALPNNDGLFVNNPRFQTSDLLKIIGGQFSQNSD
ncbi:triose-phosphate isomerase, partial [Candidatus Saganbacteria bacterium]|nr:triose-phosphate isomerase [Candidatus Saganbacteria bacterium]